ncbi:MAG: hypothetical protein AAF602_29175 [Myxococcota bacterium]
MFYVITTTDLRPDTLRNPTTTGETVGIYRTPGRTNQSHEERAEGWLGTTNNIDRHALGAFDTEVQARNFVAEEYPTAHEDLAERVGEGDLVVSYTVHKVDTGEIIAFDHDAEDIFEQLDAVPADADWLYLSDIGALETHESVPEHIAEADDPAAAIEEWARERYGRVQRLERSWDGMTDGYAYVIAMDPVAATAA